MIKTKPEVGTKVRCVDTGGCFYLTKGKVYEIYKTCKDVEYYGWKFWYKDDDGDIMFYDNEEGDEKFELVEKEDKQMNKESLFKVGDVVWDLIYGKGVVKKINNNSDAYPVIVKFDVNTEDSFTQEGKRFVNQVSNRTLFFSEPKIEALTERPFVPTLVGKTLLIYSEGFPNGVVRKVIKETPDKIEYDSFGNYHMKKNILEMYEVSKENLVTHKG